MIFLSELNDCRQSDYGKARKYVGSSLNPTQVERPLDFSPSPVSPVGEVDEGGVSHSAKLSES